MMACVSMFSKLRKTCLYGNMYSYGNMYQPGLVHVTIETDYLELYISTRSNSDKRRNRDMSLNDLLTTYTTTGFRQLITSKGIIHIILLSYTAEVNYTYVPHSCISFQHSDFRNDMSLFLFHTGRNRTENWSQLRRKQRHSGI